MGFSTFPDPDGQAVTANVPVTLAYAQSTSSLVGILAEADVPGLSASFTVDGARRVRVTAFILFNRTVGDGTVTVRIREGATQLTQTDEASYGTDAATAHCVTVLTPSAGTHTYRVTMQRPTGTGTVTALGSTTYPAFILVEDITGAANPVPSPSVPVGVLGQSTSASAPTTASATMVDLGVSVNVVVPAGRTLRVFARMAVAGPAGDIVDFYIRQDGVEVTGVTYWQDQGWGTTVPPAETLVSPSAGSHTYTCVFRRATGTGTTTSQGCYLYVEDVTPTPAPTISAPSSTLGYAEVIAQQAGITTEVDLTGLSVTVTVPAGRRIRVTGYTNWFTTVNNDRARLLITNGANTQLQRAGSPLLQTTGLGSVTAELVLSPAAGVHTFKLRGLRDVGTGSLTMYALGNVPAYILVEDITGVGVPVHDHAAAPTSTLGYAEVTANQTSITAEVDLAGLSVTATVAAGRRIRVLGSAYFTNTGTSGYDILKVYEDGVQKSERAQPADPDAHAVECIAILSPSAGTHTWKLRAQATGGTATSYGNALYPAYILVEDITGVGVPGHTHSQLDDLTDTGWLIPTLLNNWTNYGSGWTGARYRRKNGIVYMQGLIAAGTSGSSAFTLPVGFRPDTILMIASISGEPWTVTRVDVSPNGGVSVTRPGNSWATITCSFPADQ